MRNGPRRTRSEKILYAPHLLIYLQKATKRNKQKLKELQGVNDAYKLAIIEQLVKIRRHMNRIERILRLKGLMH